MSAISITHQFACEDRGCVEGRTHQGSSYASGYEQEQWAPCGRPCAGT